MKHYRLTYDVFTEGGDPSKYIKYYGYSPQIKAVSKKVVFKKKSTVAKMRAFVERTIIKECEPCRQV